MKYSEVKQDLFSVSEDYYFAHCVSRDFKMGAGIALTFRKKFPYLNNLESGMPEGFGKHLEGGCVKKNRVYNLTTKERYWHKPTYKSIRAALLSMRGMCEHNGTYKVAMPKIGSGLDKLKWEKVRDIIYEVFEETDIEILVCYQ